MIPVVHVQVVYCTPDKFNIPSHTIMLNVIVWFPQQGPTACQVQCCTSDSNLLVHLVKVFYHAAEIQKQVKLFQTYTLKT